MQSRLEYSVITNRLLRNFFVSSSNVSVMNPLGIWTECSNSASWWKSLSKWQDCLINEPCGKSFFSSAMLVGFGVYIIPVSHPTHDNSMDWDLAT